MKARRLPAVCALFIICGLLSPSAGAANIDCPDRMAQGGICPIIVSGDDTVSSVTGAFGKRHIYFNPTGTPGTFRGLLGVDLAAEPEMKLLIITTKKVNGTGEIDTKNITVKPGDFSVQRLTLDKKWEVFDDKTRERIQHENKIASALYSTETPKRLWEEPFMMPLIGRITTGFGLIRYINGDPSTSHAGLDIGAISGTQVLAANDGRVALVMDMFFSGLSLFIDHGQGLYTTYFHLSDVLVKEGDIVKRGQKIALVGATGRVTGPHLHFAVRLNSNKVNPYDLVDKQY